MLPYLQPRIQIFPTTRLLHRCAPSIFGFVSFPPRLLNL